MKNNKHSYQVSVTLVTRASLLVQANSAQEAQVAVQRDLDTGGEILCDWLVEIENTIPHSASEVHASGTPFENDQESDFFVTSSGDLVKTP